jgi:hypothetical protein
MTSPAPDLAAVAERLERLERDHRPEKRRARWLLVTVGLEVVALLLVWTLVNTTATAQAQGAKVIRANQFVLDDEKGRPRVWLYVDENGPRMTMLDENGQGDLDATMKTVALVTCAATPEQYGG